MVAAESEVVDDALDVLRRERPDIAVPPIELIDYGFSSYILRTGSDFIVRVARTPDAAANHSREYRLLQQIHPQISVGIPDPVWRLPAGERSKFGAMAYSRLAGDPLPRDTTPAPDLISQLSRFLHEVHVSSCPATDPMSAWQRGTVALARTSVEHLARELPPDEHLRLRNWSERFADLVSRRDAGVLVHGDFWHANILTDGNRLTGVLDWESATIADPAADLAPVWDIDPDLGADLLREYQRRDPDPSLDERVRMLRIARNLGGITWSIENNDPEEYADSLGKVRSVLPLV
ncbi:MAG TPA: aminoglycoside phosphotransferase family protein [Mycobacteriales bacterium]|nr:aminoglycoside phosphotransferase family protein [Mycobacteriales bacterium]